MAARVAGGDYKSPPPDSRIINPAERRCYLGRYGGNRSATRKAGASRYIVLDCSIVVIIVLAALLHFQEGTPARGRGHSVFTFYELPDHLIQL